MHENPTPARPAILPVLAVLAGIALASGSASPISLAAIATFAGFGAVVLRSPVPRRVFLLLTFAAAGAASGAWASERAARRGAGWLPENGSVVEVELLGTVLRAPERDRRGELWLRMAARPERDPRPDAGAANLRLVVRAGPSGPAVAALRHGDRVRVFARLRAARGSGSAVGEGLARLAGGVDATGSIKSARLVEKIAEGAAGPARAIDLVLAAARGRLDRSLGEADDARHAAAAMLLGDRAGMDPGTLRALRESGLFHLLAISGLNVALLVGAGFVVLRRLRLSRWLVFALVAPALWAFGVLVGADPPVTRACAGTALALAGRTLGRDGDPLNTLAVVVGVLALADPASIFHPGFQLTFAATAGLIAAARPFAAAIPGPRAVAYALGASAAAYVATAPVLAWHFGKLAPVALVSNLAGGALCGAVLGSGAAVLAAADAPIAGARAAWALRHATSALDGLARAAAGAPFASIRVVKPSATMLLAVVTLLVTAWAISRRPRGGGARGRWARAAAAVGILALHLGPVPRAPALVEVAIIDVGQGQAVAVRGANGGCLLLDGGGSGGGRFDAGERIVAPWLAAWGCRRIEAVIVSHAHDDHVGGLDSIVREFDTGTVWFGAGAWRDEATRSLAALVRERGGSIALAIAGARSRVGDLEISILHPGTDDSRLPINDRCVVARIVTADGTSLLVPGDLERTGERRVLSRGPGLASQALVVGHHGAGASSSEDWLAAVGPAVAVVSVGEGNRFGHPAPATLERLRRHRVTTHRTDRGGTVVLREEAGGWHVVGGPLRGRRETAPE